MRGLRLLLVAAGLLVAVLLAGLWLAPAMLDWGRYRTQLAALASTAVGRPVRIEGSVTLQLLPEPILTASRITIQDRRQGGTLSVRRLRLRVGLGSLAAGRIDARELVLEQPELRLPWPLEPGSVPARPGWLANLAARIEGGTLVLGEVTFSDITATVTTDPDSDGLAAAGVARLFGLPWTFTTRLGAADGARSSAVQATLDGQGRMRDTGGRFSGRLAEDGSLQGQISGRGPDLSLVLPAPAVPWRAEGRLTAAGGLAAADELALEIAGSPARGAVALRVAPMPRLDVALAASRLNLDAWLPVLLQGSPGRIETGIDLSAEAATLAGGTLRGLRSAFDLGPEGVVVRDASATLPGEASLRLTGRMQPAAAPATAATFQGSAAITLPDLRTTLRWLEDAHLGVPGGLPPEVLRSGQLSAEVTLSRQSASLTKLSGMLDGAALAGRAELVFAAASPPSLDLALQLDRLALDPWLPDPLHTLAHLPGLLRGIDSRLHLQAAHASLRGLLAEPLSLDALTTSGGLTVQRLEGNVQGLHAVLAGAISESGRIGDGRIDVEADHAEPLAALLARTAVADSIPAALLHGPVALHLRASGPPEALAGRIELDLADAQLVAQPTVNLSTGAWSGSLTLRHPGAPRLLEMLGISNPAAWLGDGSLSLIGQLAGAPGLVSADRFELTAGALRASGSLRLDQGAGLPRLSGRIAADPLPLPLPKLRATDPMPFRLLRGWQADLRLDAAQVLGGGETLLSHATTHLTLDAGHLHIEHLTGGLAEGALTADALIDAGAEPPAVTLQAGLTGASPGPALFATPVDLGGGTIDTTATLHAQGYSPLTLLSTLAGTASLAARNGHLSGFDAAAATAALGASPDAAVLAGVRTALLGGTTPFTRLDATASLAHGIATTTATAATPSALANLAGTLDLTVPATDLTATVTPALSNPPILRVRLIPPVVLPDLTDLTRWLSARP